jgi:gas vesicle structural protein
VRVSLLGIELLTIDARIVIASVDTYLRFAEAVGRLDLSRREPQTLGDLVGGAAKGAVKSGAKSKVKGAVESAGEKVEEKVSELTGHERDEQTEDGGQNGREDS